jgi:glyoxylate reductase
MTMARIYVTRQVPPPGPQMLSDSSHQVQVSPHDRPLHRQELIEAVAGCHGLLAHLQDPIDAQVMDAAGPQLRVISNYAVGYNNIDVAEATRRGVVVCNTPGVLTEATADIAWILLMGVARRISEGERIMRSGQSWSFSQTFMLGSDVRGRTLVIVGAGRIGAAVARRARAWGMRLIYVSRRAHEDFETELGAARMELDAALVEADFVSLHVPLTDQTRHLIDARRLHLMKRTAYLVNTSRGPVVDEAALVAALRQGTIAGAGLDVYEHEPATAPGLIECPNTLLLPHLGSATVQTRGAMAEMAVRNLLGVLDGSGAVHAVNAERVKSKVG